MASMDTGKDNESGVAQGQKAPPAVSPGGSGADELMRAQVCVFACTMCVCVFVCVCVCVYYIYIPSHAHTHTHIHTQLRAEEHSREIEEEFDTLLLELGECACTRHVITEP